MAGKYICPFWVVGYNNLRLVQSFSLMVSFTRVKQTADEGLTGNDGSRGSDYNADGQETIRHDGVKHRMLVHGLSFHAHGVGTLSEIIDHEHYQHKRPAHAHIHFPAMPQIGIQRLGSCGAKKYTSQQPESAL